MLGFEISGTKGTYLELEDGRFADTVAEGTILRGNNLEQLRAEVTEFVDKPLCTTMSVVELAIYVGVR